MANLSKITIGAEEPRFQRQKTVSDKCVYKDIQKWGRCNPYSNDSFIYFISVSMELAVKYYFTMWGNLEQ